MTTLLDFAKLLLQTIEEIGAEYMLGGALGVMAYGEARATQDIDLVLHLPLDKIGAFSEALANCEVLIPPEVILDHLLETRADLPLSGIHLSSGHRADIYLLQEGDELRAAALARKRLFDFGSVLGEIYVHSPEDLILYKLQYFAISQQDKHVRDIAAIWLAQKGQLDEPYLERWILKMGLQNYWQEIMSAVQKLEDEEKG